MSSKTVISVKTDKSTKQRAQAVAKDIGIPLSTIINAYLRELAVTGTVHFAAAEHMTPKMEKIIAQIDKDIKDEKNLSPAFDNAKEAAAWLKRQTG